jgi:hypothetical protein
VDAHIEVRRRRNRSRKRRRRRRRKRTRRRGSGDREEEEEEEDQERSKVQHRSSACSQHPPYRYLPLTYVGSISTHDSASSIASSHRPRCSGAS